MRTTVFHGLGLTVMSTALLASAEWFSVAAASIAALRFATWPLYHAPMALGVLRLLERPISLPAESTRTRVGTASM